MEFLSTAIVFFLQVKVLGGTLDILDYLDLLDLLDYLDKRIRSKVL